MSNENRTTALVEDETLIYQRDGTSHQIQVGTPAWYAWLQTATLFRVRSPSGTFTVRREQAGNQRGNWYWRAYLKRDGTLHRAYLGMAQEVTPERLRTVAARFFASSQPAGEEIESRSDGCQRHPVPREHVQKQPDEGAGTPASIQRTPSTLPVPLTSLIGREREMTATCPLLARPEVRILTLTGTGGVGKTRLALAIAIEVQENFPNGVSFVSLAPIRDADLVLPAIVQALGLQEKKRPPLEVLQAELLEQRRLLVLDNFEQVVTAAPLLLDLLVACPRLKLLITSREVLHVRGEREFVVQPLTLPTSDLSDDQTLIHYGAVALFLERAREVQPTSELNAFTAPLITEICRRLDGLPLALELAAARLKVLSLPMLLERLEHRLHILTSGPRDLPIRQQTLRQTIAWSYDLLSHEEQHLFRLLSILPNGCTLEYEVLKRWAEEGHAGLDDRPTSAPQSPARKVTMEAITEVRKLVGESPELGAYRVRAALEQIGIHLSQATCGRLLSLNRKLYGLPSPKGGTPRERQEMPFKAHFKHEIWSVDVRYIEEHNLGFPEPVYLISVLENYSRACLASKISATQNQWDYLEVLFAALSAFGAPSALISDGGAIFYCNQAIDVYAALSIRKERIEAGQPWQNYVESHFNIIRKMADAKFARARSWEELIATHRAWMRDYNTQRHWAHEKREDGCHSPAAVLGEQKGTVYPESVLNRILFATRYTRHLNRFGYLRVQGWKLYGERALPGELVTVWVYDGRITVEYQTVTLSKYDTQVIPDRKQITQVSNPRRAAHPFRSPQLTLIDVSPSEWRLYWRAPTYQQRHSQSRPPGMVQLPLFNQELQDMAVGADAGHGGARPSTHLHFVEKPSTVTMQKSNRLPN